MIYLLDQKIQHTDSKKDFDKEMFACKDHTLHLGKGISE